LELHMLEEVNGQKDKDIYLKL